MLTPRVMHLDGTRGAAEEVDGNDVVEDMLGRAGDELDAEGC